MRKKGGAWDTSIGIGWLVELSRRGILKSGLSTVWLDDLMEEWEKIQSSSVSVPFIPSSDLPKVEEVRGFNAEELNDFLKRRLNDIDNQINTLTAEEVDGLTFFNLTHEGLKAYGISLKASTKIIKLINDIQG
ncbi:7883_t:CDS:2, partial [Acaulospora colombiana]